jgi:hypothetical protein
MICISRDEFWIAKFIAAFSYKIEFLKLMFLLQTKLQLHSNPVACSGEAKQ